MQRAYYTSLTVCKAAPHAVLGRHWVSLCQSDNEQRLTIKVPAAVFEVHVLKFIFVRDVL